MRTPSPEVIDSQAHVVTRGIEKILVPEASGLAEIKQSSTGISKLVRAAVTRQVQVLIASQRLAASVIFCHPLKFPCSATCALQLHNTGEAISALSVIDLFHMYMYSWYNQRRERPLCMRQD